FDKPGMSILGLTQRKAHRAIRAVQATSSKPRKTTEENLALIKATISDECGFIPTTRTIWRDLQDASLSRNVRVFLWKGIHGAHKIGEYFRKMPERWRVKGDCPSCGVVESMQHILFECEDSGQHIIWKFVEGFLEKKKLRTDLNIGLIWGCASFRATYASNTTETSRAFRIVVSESAFLIWKIRCERRIEHGEEAGWHLSTAAIRARWDDVIRKRVCQDFRLMNKKIYGRFALNSFTVRETW
ncbi:hypothetical protein AURDEDRAFT_32316, partial [Auricularia subglabra TFB-10046 SS5]